MRWRISGLFLVVLTLLPGAASCTDARSGKLRNGDIIFHTSRSGQSQAIQAATHSDMSHMGIIFFRNEEPYVLEAIRTVQATPLLQWIERGAGQRYVIKRLRNADTILTAAAETRLRAVAGTFHGKPYDLTFEWSDSRIYCSELVWKIYDRALDLQIGSLQQLREFDLSHPAVRAKMAERYGTRIPLDETVISPAAMFRSHLLETVIDR